MKKIKKVLVIDDDQINNIIFEKLSAIVDFADEIATCTSAVDGLDYLQNIQKNNEAPPNLLFLDIRMPIVNGWEFLERFQHIRHPYFKDTIINMLTSSSDKSDINKAKTFNIDIVSNYFVKPLSVEVLSDIKEKYQAQQITENLYSDI